MLYKIPQVVVIVDRGIVEKISRIVSSHEIPILEMIHGVVTIDDEATEGLNGLEKDIKSSVDEYGDLARIYGDDSKTGIAFVERVYGYESKFADILEEFRVAGDEVVEQPKKRVTRNKSKVDETE